LGEDAIGNPSMDDGRGFHPFSVSTSIKIRGKTKRREDIRWVRCSRCSWEGAVRSLKDGVYCPKCGFDLSTEERIENPEQVVKK